MGKLFSQFLHLQLQLRPPAEHCFVLVEVTLKIKTLLALLLLKWIFAHEGLATLLLLFDRAAVPPIDCFVFFDGRAESFITLSFFHTFVFHLCFNSWLLSGLLSIFIVVLPLVLNYLLDYALSKRFLPLQLWLDFTFVLILVQFGQFRPA